MSETFTRRAFVGLAGAAGTSGIAGRSGSLPNPLGVGDGPATSTAWEATYGRGGVTWTGDVVATADGGYLLACSSAPEREASDEAWLVKVDGAGNREWDRGYGGEDGDKARSVVRGPDGGYTFLGVTYSKGEGDAWLVHVDDEGTVEWERTFADRYPRDLLATGDGEYLLAGRTGHAEDPSSDAWLAKLAADGADRWQATFPDGEATGDDERGEAEATAVAETDDGYVFVGNTARAGDWYAWLATVDEAGRLVDEQFLDEARLLSAVVQGDDGGFVVAGIHESTTATYNVGWLAGVGSDGSVEWSRTWNRVTPSALAVTDQGYAVAGDYDVPWPFGYFEAWAAFVAPDGEERWAERRRKNGGEGFDQVLPTADGYLFLGHTGPAFPDEDEFAEKEAWLLELAEGRQERGWLPDAARVGDGAGLIGVLSLAGLGVVGAAIVAWRRRDDDADGESGRGQDDTGDAGG